MRKNIAIIMGGYSSEYKISLKSGNVVYETLDKEKYNAYRIHIFKETISLYNLLFSSDYLYTSSWFLFFKTNHLLSYL